MLVWKAWSVCVSTATTNLYMCYLKAAQRAAAIIAYNAPRHHTVRDHACKLLAVAESKLRLSQHNKAFVWITQPPRTRGLTFRLTCTSSGRPAALKQPKYTVSPAGDGRTIRPRRHTCYIVRTDRSNHRYTDLHCIPAQSCL